MFAFILLLKCSTLQNLVTILKLTSKKV
jgi:hypothetical protein